MSKRIYSITEETRKKISLAKLGKPRFDIRGENNPAKRLEVRKKISLALKGKPKPWLSKLKKGKPQLECFTAEAIEKQRKILRMRMLGNKYRLGLPPWNKGKALTKEQKDKIREKTKEGMLKNDAYRKISLSHKMKGIKPPFRKGIKFTEEQKAKLKLRLTKAYQRILNEIPELEKQGFRCIPIGKVIPDIIGIKDGKVYATEVEYDNPRYDKYTDDIRKYYDDIIWILRKPSLKNTIEKP